MSLSITLPNRNILCEELLLGVEKRPLNMEIANIIYGHFQNKESYFIEYEVWEDPRLDKPQSKLLHKPNLWRYNDYVLSSERWKKQRNNAEQDRVKGWIEKANIRMVSYHIQRSLLLDEEKSNLIAYRLVHRNMWKNIRALGIMKQITKEEEL